LSVSRNPETLKAWKEKNIDRMRGYYRAYYHRNKARINADPEKKAYRKKWAEENREEQRAYARQWYAEHKQEVALQRGRKKLERFGPPKQRTKMPAEEYRLRRIASSRHSQERRQLLYWTLKCKFTCARCDEADPACLQFHHREPSAKEMNIGNAGRCSSPEKLLAEIVKCDVLCDNCHRKHHYEESGGFSIKTLTDDEVQEILAKAEKLYEYYVRHMVN
jgi:hypothetical protein